jgi:hypothetical protein
MSNNTVRTALKMPELYAGELTHTALWGRKLPGANLSKKMIP